METPPDSAADGSVVVDETETPVPGGRLVLATVGEVAGFDPAINVGGSLGGSELTALYDVLLAQDPVTGEISPQLAAGIETDDAITWTLRLREGVRFTDGTPLDADAVRANIEYHQDPDRGSQAFAQASLIASTTVVDPLTLEVTLAEAQVSFASVFADKLAWVFSPTAREELGDDFNIAPVGAGAGPFRFVSWTVDDRMVLERNPDYWNQPLPHLDRLEFVPIPDDAVRLSGLNAGQFDAMFTRVSADIANWRADGGLTATFGRNLDGFIQMNHDRPPFSEPICRRAVATAMDLDVINQVVFNGASIMSRDIFRPDSSWLAVPANQPEYDVERARELVEECSNLLGEPAAFDYRCFTTPENELLAEVLLDMWTQVGFDVTLNCTETGEMVDAVIGGEYQASTWSTPVGVDPDPGLYQSFHSGSARNFSNTANTELDSLLEAGRRETDPERRFEIYADVQSLFAEQVPVAIFTKTEEGWVIADGVESTTLTTGGALLMDRVLLGR